jgi:hypothetical protein
MSPLTAFFLGLFGVGAVGIVSATLIVFAGMLIVGEKAGDLVRLADGTITTTLDRLPGLIESLPESVGDILNDGRAPEYSDNLDIKVAFATDERARGVRPVMTITNTGEEVVSLLAVRVAALSQDSLPLREWTEVVATPIGMCNDWRGPLYPGNTRYVVLGSSWRSFPMERLGQITGAVEISDVRIWRPTEGL